MIFSPKNRRLFGLLTFILAVGCQSDEVRWAVFLKQFPTDFFQQFPDSAAVQGRWLDAENLLDAPSEAFFEKKIQFLKKKRAKLEAIDPLRFSAETQKAQQFLFRKIKNLENRLASDWSLLDARPTLESVWKNRSVAEEKRRAAFLGLLKKTPQFYEAAQTVFSKRAANATIQKAIAAQVETFRFLAARRADFPKNPDLEAAILAVKNWVAFCESSRFLSL